MRKIRVFLVCMVFAGTKMLSAQSAQVSGIVTDAADGQPLPGVSVVVKDAGVSTTTDANGRYTINVADDATLVFTFIGMKTQEATVAGRTTINVALETGTVKLEDVVVVAYGTTTKERFTGSVATVKNDKIVRRQTSNVTNALSGQVAGVQTFSAGGGQPGTAATVRIRGFGSMSASNSPLYVIDGVPYNGTLSSINNADIESLSVLKDASASAIYGARGANGVILVTTKKGKTGEAVVTVDARVGSNSRAIPAYEVMTDPAMYYETFYKALYNSKVQAGSEPIEAHAYARNALLNENAGGLGYQVYTVPLGEYLIGTNGKLNPRATLGYYDGEYYYTPDNWYDELFNRGNLRQEYNVSVSGATEKLRYYLSAGHLDDSGIIDGSSFSRWTTALNVDYQAKKWLKVGTNLSYTNYNSRAPGEQTDWGSSGNLFYLSSLIAPIYPMYVRNADGSIKTDNNGYTVYDFGSTTNQTRKFMPMANPAITLKLDKNNACTDVVTNKWFAIIDILEGLQFTTNIGLNVRNQRSSSLSNMFYGSAVSAGGYVGVRHGQDIGLNQQYLLTYKKGFGKHNLDILAGYESYEYTVKSLAGSNKQLYNPDIAELNNTIFDIPSVSSNTSHYVTKGFLSRVQYDFQEKIFLSASYRRDASSRFAPEHRWGNFGSLGAAWNLSKEEFFKDLNAGWIDLLKLKASYGIQGNDNLGNDYAYLDQYSVSNNGAGDFALTLSYKGNREITWETSYSFNTGIEFELLEQKISGSVEYFNRETIDLLYNQPVSLSLGYSSIPMNVGSIVNQGVELDINVNILKTENIRWDVNLNATSLSNKITDLHENVKETGIKGTVRIYKVGGSLYNIFLREYAGVDPASGKALYYKVDENNHYVLDPNGNKMTTDNYGDTYQVDLGNSLPWLFGGFGATADLFGFDISLAFSYQLGGKTFDMSYQQLMHTGYSSNAGANWHKDILNAWTPENPNTDVPRLNSSDNSDQQHSSRFLVNSDYLSLNNVTVGYTLPQKWVSPLKISSLRVYFTADNVALLTARKGLDPRQSAGVASWNSVSSHIYTALRTISGGMTIKF